MNYRSLCGLMCAGLMACGGRSVDTSTSSGEGTTGQSTSTEAESGPETGSESDTMLTDDATSDTWDSTSSSESTGETGGFDLPPDLCPSEEDVRAGFSFTPSDADISETCTLMSLSGPLGNSLLIFACPTAGEVSLRIDSDLTTNGSLSPGQMYRLEYRRDLIFWINQWFAVQDPAAEQAWTYLGGISGSALAPPNSTTLEFFGNPSVEIGTEACPPTAQECSDEVRESIEFTLREGYSATVFDDTVGFIDILAYGYEFAVESAIHNVPPIACSDTPERWFQMVFASFPSD